MHDEFISDVTECDTVFLCIHGILGSPDHFDFLLQTLPETVSVHNILLDGHGKNIEDFAQTSMYKWQAQIEQKIEYLSSNYDNIIIVGHSMGTLFGLELSVRYTSKIKFLFLLQTPMKMGLKPSILKHSYQVLFNKIDYNDKICVACKDSFSINIETKLYKYFSWTPRYLELFKKAYDVRQLIENISVPCVVFQSKFDELVPISSCKVIQKNSNIKLNVLNNSSHFYYEDLDLQLILNEFEKIKEEYGIH